MMTVRIFMLGEILIPIFCHLVGDYVLQSNFVSVGKTASWYLLFVHCALYILPFYIAYGLDLRLGLLFAHHFLIDMLGRWGKLRESWDQFNHFVMLAVYIV